eukprot:scaffold2054_cov19-Tisochrysis_lutea.AAC.1
MMSPCCSARPLAPWRKGMRWVVVDEEELEGAAGGGATPSILLPPLPLLVLVLEVDMVAVALSLGKLPIALVLGACGCAGPCSSPSPSSVAAPASSCRSTMTMDRPGFPRTVRELLKRVRGACTTSVSASSSSAPAAAPMLAPAAVLAPLSIADAAAAACSLSCVPPWLGASEECLPPSSALSPPSSSLLPLLAPRASAQCDARHNALLVLLLLLLLLLLLRSHHLRLCGREVPGRVGEHPGANLGDSNPPAAATAAVYRRCQQLTREWIAERAAGSERNELHGHCLHLGHLALLQLLLQ